MVIAAANRDGAAALGGCSGAALHSEVGFKL